MSIFPKYKETTYGDRNQRSTALATIKKLIPGTDNRFYIRVDAQTGNQMLSQLGIVVQLIQTIASLLIPSNQTRNMTFNINRTLVGMMDASVPFTARNNSDTPDSARIRIRPNAGPFAMSTMTIFDDEHPLDKDNRMSIQGNTLLEAFLSTNDKHAVRIFTKGRDIEIYTNVLTWEIIYTALTFPLIKLLDRYEQRQFPEVRAFLAYLAMGKTEEAEAELRKIIESDKSKEYAMLQVKERLFQNSDALERKYSDDITQHEDAATNAYTAYIQALQEIENTKLQLEAARLKSSDIHTADEIIKFLLKNPYIKYIIPAAENNSYSYNANKADNWKFQIILLINSPLTDFDDASYSRTIDGTLNSKLPEQNSNKVLRVLMKLALDAVFKEQKYRLWTYSAVRLDTSTYSVENAISSNQLTAPKPGVPSQSDWQVGLPQPHISQHGCWGSYRDAITKWLRSPDYLGIFSQIVQATTNINFSDSTVVRSMVGHWIKDWSKPAFENLETGEMLSLAGVMKELMSEELKTELREYRQNHSQNNSMILDAVFNTRIIDPLLALDLIGAEGDDPNFLGTEFGVDFRQTVTQGEAGAMDPLNAQRLGITRETTQDEQGRTIEIRRFEPLPTHFANNHPGLAEEMNMWETATIQRPTQTATANTQQNTAVFWPPLTEREE